MSRFFGRQYKGASRDAKAIRRAEATERQARFDAVVAHVASEQNCMPSTAREIVRRRYTVNLRRKAATQ